MLRTGISGSALYRRRLGLGATGIAVSYGRFAREQNLSLKLRLARAARSGVAEEKPQFVRAVHTFVASSVSSMGKGY